MPGRSAARMRLRSAWLGLGWLGVAGLVVLSLIPAPPAIPVEQGDKVGHLGSYAVLMWWFAQAWLRRDARALTAVGLLALGIALEFVQGWTGYRTFSIADMTVDGLGIALGWLLAPPRTRNLLQRAAATMGGR
jgi:VanZ family protein